MAKQIIFTVNDEDYERAFSEMHKALKRLNIGHQMKVETIEDKKLKDLR